MFYIKIGLMGYMMAVSEFYENYKITRLVFCN